MAFSLEAALVVPLAIGTWLGLTITAVPVYNEVFQAARLETLATAVNIAADELYAADCLQDGNAWTTSLRTSPQKAIELVSLIVDDCRIIIDAFPVSMADLTPQARPES